MYGFTPTGGVYHVGERNFGLGYQGVRYEGDPLIPNMGGAYRSEYAHSEIRRQRIAKLVRFGVTLAVQRTNNAEGIRCFMDRVISSVHAMQTVSQLEPIHTSYLSGSCMITKETSKVQKNNRGPTTPPKHTQHLSLIHISEPTRPY